MISYNKLLSLLILLLFVLFTNTGVASTRRDITNTLEKPVVRGGIVYKHYCSLCHGERGDGNSQARKLYGELSLRISRKSMEYYTTILLDGGKSVNKSEYMPPWRDELSDEQINDVIAYLSIVSNDVKRGEVVFKTNCILCHGINADGNGRAASFYEPKPTNLLKSDKNTDYIKIIIGGGGESMGRSQAMPAWGTQLSTQEINDLADYIISISKK